MANVKSSSWRFTLPPSLSMTISLNFGLLNILNRVYGHYYNMASKHPLQVN